MAKRTDFLASLQVVAHEGAVATCHRFGQMPRLRDDLRLRMLPAVLGHDDFVDDDPHLACIPAHHEPLA